MSTLRPLAGCCCTISRKRLGQTKRLGPQIKGNRAFLCFWVGCIFMEIEFCFIDIEESVFSVEICLFWVLFWAKYLFAGC